jgi:hypothetical protein
VSTIDKMKNNEIKKFETKSYYLYSLDLSKVYDFKFHIFVRPNFWKIHLDLITCQKTHCFIYECVEIDSSYLQDRNASLVMVNWGAMKDVEPFITWCPTRREKKFNLHVAKVCFNQYLKHPTINLHFK